MSFQRKVLIVTSSFEGAASALEKEAARIADPVAQVPGLIWKLWLENPETRTVGGVYLFESEEALRRFIDGPIAAALKSASRICASRVSASIRPW